MAGKIINLFAGGGGSAWGMRRAFGRDPDIALNHSAAAIAMHAANHPRTLHLLGDVYDYKPRDVVGNDNVWALWASPTCTHFSQAKGGPLDIEEATRIRSLAWVVVDWARDVRPAMIFVENVAAFESWGPLDEKGKAIKERKGETFREWVRALERLGYVVEWRVLRASDYGAPTTRQRLFVVARCDGEAIAWPEPTHGPGLLPVRTAAECIDWTIPCPSIFGRELTAATLARIERGLRKFVIDCDDPFVVNNSVPFVPYLIHRGNGERRGQAPRIYDVEEPLRTVVAGGMKHALVCAFIAKHYGGHEGSGADLRVPLSTITTRDHHALVTAGIDDIGMRWLTPRELFNAQGFPPDWILDPIVKGKRLSPTAQVRCAGNAVPPDLADAVCSAQLGERRMAA